MNSTHGGGWQRQNLEPVSGDGALGGVGEPSPLAKIYKEV